jgi:5-methylcytosine-specific restriction endonuclease McrA
VGSKRRRNFALKTVALVEAQRGRCAYCDKKFTHLHPCPRELVEPTFDHVVPKSRWPDGKKGRDGIQNGLAACGPCNVGKGDRYPTPREMAVLERVRPLAEVIYARLKHEADLAYRMERHGIVLNVEWRMYTRPADMAYVEREQAALTAATGSE